MNLSLGCFVLFLTLLETCDSRPTLCKDGKLYEESVFDYINCSHCLEQSHYKNCKTCCPTMAPTSTRYDKTLTLVQSSNRPLTKALEGEASSAPSDDKRFPTKENGIAFLVGFLSALITVWILMHVTRCRVRRRSRQSPRPPMQETQPSLTASPQVVVGCPVSGEDTDLPTS